MNSNNTTKYARKTLVRSPMRNQVLFIVGLFIVASMILITMGYIQSETFNSVRSFVRGEGLWGKAQKDATFYLEQYALTRSEQYFDKFHESLEVNLGDKDARLALSNDPPDIERARVGFLKGGNHPEDIDSLITFFIRFEHFYYMQLALDVWERGDIKIEELFQLGEKIHLCIKSQSDHCITPLIHDLELLNEELNDIAIEFSLVLSEGARWIKSTLMTTSLIIIFLLAFGIYFIARKIIIVLDKNEQELMFSENRFLSLYNASVVGMMDWHVDGRILSANNAFLNMIGYSQDDLNSGRLNWRTITPEQFKKADKKAAKQIIESGYCQAYEKAFIHKDGHQVCVYIGSAILQGINDRGICFVIDQTLQKQSQTQLKLSATVFDASSDGMIIMDQNKHIVSVNKAYCQLTGLTSEQLIGYTPPILRSKTMSESFYRQISDTLKDTGMWNGDISGETQDGRYLTLRLNINSVRDNHYRISHYVASISDISERKAMEEQLKKLAHFDFLTGLANRGLYNERLKHSLSRAKRHKTQCALLFFDLDKFKPINDQYGHEIGDKVLQTIAQRVQKDIRTNDTIARLGGDEFVIILEDINQVQHVAQFAQKLIARVSNQIVIDNKTLEVGCSIGISLYPDDGDDGITLTRNADIAMYAAKGSGRNCYYFFNSKYN